MVAQGESWDSSHTKRPKPRRGERIDVKNSVAPPGLCGFVWSQTHGLRRGLLPFAPAGADKQRNIKTGASGL
jgi:hypothetical protein